MKSAALVGLLLVAESALAQPDQSGTAIVLAHRSALLDLAPVRLELPSRG